MLVQQGVKSWDVAQQYLHITAMVDDWGKHGGFRSILGFSNHRAIGVPPWLRKPSYRDRMGFSVMNYWWPLSKKKSRFASFSLLPKSRRQRCCESMRLPHRIWKIQPLNWKGLGWLAIDTSLYTNRVILHGFSGHFSVGDDNAPVDRMGDLRPYWLVTFPLTLNSRQLSEHVTHNFLQATFPLLWASWLLSHVSPLFPIPRIRKRFF